MPKTLCFKLAMIFATVVPALLLAVLAADQRTAHAAEASRPLAPGYHVAAHVSGVLLISGVAALMLLRLIEGRPPQLLCRLCAVAGHDPRGCDMPGLRNMPGEPPPAGGGCGAAPNVPQDHAGQLQEAARLTLLSIELCETLDTVECSYTEMAAMLQEKSVSVFHASAGLLYLALPPDSGALTVISTAEAATLAPGHSAWATDVATRAWQSQWIVTDAAPPEGPPATAVALPLFHSGRVLGSFVLIRPCSDSPALSSSMWSPLVVFAKAIATACANIELMVRHRRYAEELEDLVARRTHELQRSRDLLRLIFDNLPEGLVLITDGGELLAANSAFCQGILGRSPQTVVGCDYGSLWYELELAGVRTEWQGFFPHGARDDQQPANQAPGSESTRVLCTDAAGEQRWYAVDRIPVLGEGGTLQYLERWRDITRQEELQRQLLLHDQLTSLGRLAASVAHEVGNPLQSAMGCLDLCRDDPGLPERVVEYLGLAQGELERMGRTLESIRNLYRPPRPIWGMVEVNLILRHVEQLTRRQFTRHRVRLELILDETMPAIHGQGDALRQVFLNLVLNAQEAMPHGGRIEVVSRWRPDEGVCQIIIRDTGTGMHPEQLDHLFEPFHSRKAQGVGLGIYLSKQIVEQHHGRIDFHSVVGEGTTVDVILPRGVSWPTNPL